MYQYIPYHPASLRQSHTTILSSPLYLGLSAFIFFCFSDQNSVRNPYKPVLFFATIKRNFSLFISQKILLSTRPRTAKILVLRWTSTLNEHFFLVVLSTLIQHNRTYPPCPEVFLSSLYDLFAMEWMWTTINPLTPELNPSAQRCLTRFFTGDFASLNREFR
jgi:hypothetical protein